MKKIPHLKSIELPYKYYPVSDVETKRPVIEIEMIHKNGITQITQPCLFDSGADMPTLAIAFLSQLGVDLRSVMKEENQIILNAACGIEDCEKFKCFQYPIKLKIKNDPQIMDFDCAWVASEKPINNLFPIKPILAEFDIHFNQNKATLLLRK